MKINGKQLSEVNKEIVVIPRQSGDIVFTCSAVLDYDEFEKIHPEPKPPYIRRPGEKDAVPDLTDKEYQDKLQDRGRLKMNWMFLKSLLATPGLEFETVKLNDPKTWDKLDEELMKSGFSLVERTQIMQGVMRANSLDFDYIEKARARFFASQAAQVVK